MDQYYKEFIKLLEDENKYECVKYVKELLENKKLNIIELYELVLGPAMCCVGEKVINQEEKIWQEHLHAGIVRTVLENCYTYVFEEAINNINSKKVIVLTPSEEFHEIGPRMVNDFFTILGFDTTYVGVNTPKEEFLLAIKNVKPDLIAISISNYYNIFKAKEYIDFAKEKCNEKFKIVVGGCAFECDKEAYKKINADYYAKTYEDLKNIGRMI